MSEGRHNIGGLAAWGDIFQIAYVTAAFDEALAYWTGTVGAGPFFVSRGFMLRGWRYKGAPVDIALDLALGYWGDHQIELIRQTCRTPSVYIEWQDAGRTGVHHFGLYCEEGARARAAVGAAGLEIIQDVDGPTGGVFYVDQPGQTTLEFISRMPIQDRLFAAMKDARASWDGVSEPIRSLTDLVSQAAQAT